MIVKRLFLLAGNRWRKKLNKLCESKKSQHQTEYEEFQYVLNNFINVVAEEVGLYKILDKLTEWLNRWSSK